MKLLQAVAEVSPVLLWLIVKCNVTTLSHPAALVKVCVAVFVELVYVVPHQVKLSHAVAVVSPVVLRFMVRCSVTRLSQPAVVEYR